MSPTDTGLSLSDQLKKGFRWLLCAATKDSTRMVMFLCESSRIEFLCMQTATDLRYSQIYPSYYDHMTTFSCRLTVEWLQACSRSLKASRSHDHCTQCDCSMSFSSVSDNLWRYEKCERVLSCYSFSCLKIKVHEHQLLFSSFFFFVFNPPFFSLSLTCCPCLVKKMVMKYFVVNVSAGSVLTVYPNIVLFREEMAREMSELLARWVETVCVDHTSMTNQLTHWSKLIENFNENWTKTETESFFDCWWSKVNWTVLIRGLINNYFSLHCKEDDLFFFCDFESRPCTRGRRGLLNVTQLLFPAPIARLPQKLQLLLFLTFYR